MELIIFDLDDTLVDTWSATFPASLDGCIDAMVKSGLDLKDKSKGVKRLAEINENSINTSEALTRYLLELGVNPELYVEIGKRAIYDFDLSNRIRPLPGVLNLLYELKSTSIDLAIVTRGGKHRQLRKIKYAGIDISLFKYFFSVDDYDKTEPYKKIIELSGCSPNSTLIVGDRYKTDLVPGKNIGASVVWIPHGRGKFNPPNKCDVDYIMYDLSEIWTLLKL